MDAKLFFRPFGGKLLSLAAVIAGAVAAAAPAEAGHGRRAGFGRNAAVWVPPVYETIVRRITVPAVYEDRTREVWHPPIYEERRVLVEIPAEIASRRALRHGRWRRAAGCNIVDQVIRPVRTDWRMERVEVRAGYYETVVERVLVRPATTKVVYEKVLVRPGYRTRPARLAMHRGHIRPAVVRASHAGRRHRGLGLPGRRAGR